MIQARIEQLHTDYGKIALWGAGGVITIFLFMYAYFLNASVWIVVERKSIEKEMATVGSRVAMLETAYFEEADKLTLGMAQSLGFNEPKETRFAIRDEGSGDTITLNR